MKAATIALVLGFSLLFGCTTSKRPSGIVLTESIRREYLNARTGNEISIARAKMIKDFQSRYPELMISPNVVDTPAYRWELAIKLGMLMQEWNPVTWKVSEVKAVLGPFREENDEYLEYVIDLGIAAAIWRFGFNEFGVVVSVSQLESE